MPARKKAELLVATRAFSAEVNGEPLLVNVGARVHADHPVVKGRQGLFGPVEPEADLETPAKRSTRRKRETKR
jgi:hypothetical protein